MGHVEKTVEIYLIWLNKDQPPLRAKLLAQSVR